MNFGAKDRHGMNILKSVSVQFTRVDDFTWEDIVIYYYLPDMSCNLGVVSLVSYQMEQKNQLDISCSFLLRGLHHQSKIHLYK